MVDFTESEFTDEELADFYRKLLEPELMAELTEREIAYCRMRLEELSEI